MSRHSSNQATATYQPGRRSSLRKGLTLLSLLALIVSVVVPQGVILASARPASSPAKAAPQTLTSTLKLSVQNIDDASAVSPYRWRIDVDDTGTPTQAPTDCFPQSAEHPTGDPDYPANCDWPSVHNFTGGAGGTDNLVTQGDQTELNATTGIVLPNGKYLISILAPGFKIGGQHFSMPIDNASPLVAKLTPEPLKLGSLKIQIFEDALTNGQFDPPGEHAPVTGGPTHNFQAHIDDVLGEVSTDWFGNPLCADYYKVGQDPPGPEGPLGVDPNGNTSNYGVDSAGEFVYISGTGGQCIDGDNDGLIVIPNLGANRYEVTVVPPDGENWIQTTTLEGGHFWDTWVYEGYTGDDVEVLMNGAPIPFAQFGYVKPRSTFLFPCASNCGQLKVAVRSTKSYLPPAGGDTDEGPVKNAWIALNDLRLGGDELLVYAAKSVNGVFNIANVPPSTYSVSMWDFDQNLLLGITTAVVDDNQVVDLGEFALPHWFAKLEGTVFVDTNQDGKQNNGEAGLAGYGLAIKSRDNSIVDQGAKLATTDSNGHYVFEQVYPYGYFTVLEAYNDLFMTTGVTYKTDNGPETTRLGAGVDVSALNMDGIKARVDWGVIPYPSGTNGGIVGEVVYAVTRNELDARLAAAEDYEPGIPGMRVNLYKTIPCGTNVGTPCSGGYEVTPTGAFAQGLLINTYITEEFVRPSDCVVRSAPPSEGGVGDEIHYPFMSDTTGGHQCIESPLMGPQVKTGPTEDTTAGGTDSEFTLVNGNYGFGDACFSGIDDSVPGFDPADPSPQCADGPDAFTSLTPADYLVEVSSPNDAFGKPKFQVVREEDVNVFDGNQYTPQVPPPACAGALHVVDVAGIGPEGPDPIDNPGFADGGGSPFEGTIKPLCDARLVPVQNGKSIAPSFFYFASVPPPGRLYGAVVEDLALGTNPNEFYYGEKAGIPNAPLGVYDYAGRLVVNALADPNGYFEILLPSTASYNCPLPAGPCPSVYKVIGNDPGQPGHPNPTYDPQYRSFESDWQMWPGLTLLADVALLPTAPVIEIPGGQTTHPPACKVESNRPVLFSVDKPNGASGASLVIKGDQFGGTAGSVTLDGTAITIDTWSNHEIHATVTGITAGPHQLAITGSSGLSTINGLTYHVTGVGYNPPIYEVGPGKTYATVQAAINASIGNNGVVVVYPNTPQTFTPLGDYLENVVISSPVKLQGTGPGGIYSDGSYVLGSILNGLGFATNRSVAWANLVEGIRSGPGWDGNQLVADGEVVFVVADNGEFGSSFKAGIDGLAIVGGNEFGAEGTFVVPNYPTQGGGIFVNAYARNLQITNNVLQGDGGAYAGAIRVGTPNVGNQHNDDLRIAHNRIVANGGSNLAGAVGLFDGTNGYEVANNDICGNFSAEYGGGLTHYGLSNPTTAHPASSIHDNRVWFNRGYDEGGGIMIAGEAQNDVTQLSPGSGKVDIYNNLIQANMSDDDGGGLRFLMAGNHLINVYNNIIANNVAAHEGGGVALDDATNLRFFNNTVMKNLSTATAQTAGVANGPAPAAPAGLSDAGNSALLQAQLPSGHAPYSDPLMFNNIFWDNRAGNRVIDGNTFRVDGLGAAGPSDITLWDMGVSDALGPLHPTNSILNEDTNSDIQASPSNQIGANPLIVDDSYAVSVHFLPWRQGAAFIFNLLVSADLPPGLLGDYHVQSGSPAINQGALSKSGVNAPAFDIDNAGRPTSTGFDVGADEQPGPVTDLVGPTVSNLAATPNPANASTVLGADASDVATGGSNITAIEWFESPDPGVGAGNPMSGSFGSPTASASDTIDTSGWSAGAHVINVRAQDSAGNWGSAATLTITIDHTVPLVILAADFEGPTLVPPWTAVTSPTQAKLNSAAALIGTQGMSVKVRGRFQSGVMDASPANESTYNARFYFDPNGARTGKGQQTIFVGKSATGKLLFQVQYRRHLGKYQVRTILTLRNGQLRTSGWYRIRDGANAIEVSWKASSKGFLRHYVDGRSKKTLTGNTRGLRLDRVRLGLVGTVPKLSRGTLFFDGFVSTRNTYIGK
ncbi:MAG: SdrD B-like domain-containing protein [Chloroflexota bacterium]